LRISSRSLYRVPSFDVSARSYSVYQMLMMVPPVSKECVEASGKMATSTVKAVTNEGYIAPVRLDDESGETTSWLNVVRKRRPNKPTGSSLVGKQSVAMLTLFTKPKIVN
jgi:hypothetical protein